MSPEENTSIELEAFPQGPDGSGGVERRGKSWGKSIVKDWIGDKVSVYDEYRTKKISLDFGKARGKVHPSTD